MSIVIPRIVAYALNACEDAPSASLKPAVRKARPKTDPKKGERAGPKTAVRDARAESL